MPYVDSVDKIVSTYFKCVTKQTFTYKNKTYDPKPLSVSPLVLRGYNCPPGCGGCCPRFSLDYLPSEEKPVGTVLRTIQFDGRQIEVYSDLQDDHKDWHCRNLNRSDARCNIYSVRPFSCDFELIRFFISDDGSRLSQQLFGRGWALLRIDDQRGALCTMTAPDIKSIAETIRKLNRLQMWADHFGIKTWVPEVINWIFSGDKSKHLRLG